MHEDTNDFGDIKPKTIGKMLDEKICLEGMFTLYLDVYRRMASIYSLTQGRWWSSKQVTYGNV